jgi:hypothetical protein
MKFVFTGLSSTVSQKVIAGNPSALKAKLAATISASGVEKEVAVCFFDRAAIGPLIFGPSILM